MQPLKLLKNTAVTLLLAIIGFQAVSCGTLLYPERKGQISGKIDPNVAILNGIGLLVFLVPGVIAFAVDFSNGTIYLPPDKSAQLPHAPRSAKTVSFDTQTLTSDKLEQIVKTETGRDIDLREQTIEVTQLHTPAQLKLAIDHISRD